jgi:hypothetical protein
MVVDGTNYATRSLAADAWSAEAQRIREALDRLDGVTLQVLRLEPGRVILSIDGFNASREAGAMSSLRRALPQWRFSEQTTYSLPETFGMREVR